jgi:PAS domain S-box-containing protein
MDMKPMSLEPMQILRGEVNAQDNVVRQWVVRYVPALFAPVATACLIQLTWPFLAANPVSPYLFAVIFCVWYGGLGPGLVSVAFSFFLAGFSLYELSGFPRREDLVRLLLLAVIGSLMSIMSELMHRERRRVQTALKASRQLAITRGIAERQQTMAALEKSERALRELARELESERGLLVEAQTLAKLGSWHSDLRTGRVSWSAENHRIFETDPDTFVPSYEAFLQFVHPADREMVAQTFLESSATGAAVQFEHRLLLPDGRIKFVEERWQVFQDEQRHPVRAVGTCLDITERKRVEDKLAQSESRLTEAQHQAHVGSWTNDLVTNEVVWSDELFRILGVAPNQVEASYEGFLRRVHPDDRERCRVAVQEAIASGAPQNVEYRILRADGVQRTLHARVFVVADEQGQVIRLTGTTQDVTERKQAEQALRDSEERYRELFENSREPTYVHDLSGRYISVNRAAEKLTGYMRAELLGRKYTEFIPGEQMKSFREQFCRQLKEEGETCYESEVIRKDGTCVPVEVSSHLIFENGVPVGVQGTARDITERKFAEQKLTVSTAQLRALSAHLQLARETEGTRIAREIHDELGSLLTSLKWDVERASRVLAGPLEPATILQLQQRFTELIKLSDVALSSIRRIASELRPSVLDDLGLAAAVEWHAQQFQGRTGIVCDCFMEEINLNEEQSTAVFRILQEALTNVLRHAEATHVVIEMTSEDGHFSLSVSDNGKGITEPQKSGHRSLGILGMRERAHLVGGEIVISGAQASGTTVTVRVPLAETTPKVREQAARALVTSR